MADQEQEQPSSSTTTRSSSDSIAITLTHHSQQHTFYFDPEATITDLVTKIEEELYIPTKNQKFLVPKLGLLKAPFLPNNNNNNNAPTLRLAENLTGKKITLMGTSSAEIEALHTASQEASSRADRLTAARQRYSAPKAWQRGRKQDDATYTFMALRPLAHLPRPERSLAFLERLRDDPGIRAAMRAHGFSVGLLAEMDPLSHTEATHEGTTRILGLNRNRGEVIELRLRTDAYDGYRDYKTIRRALCHELAHNVHGPHDRDFWDLCRRIEREVDRGDWKSGGQAVGGGGGGGDAEYYESVGTSEEVAFDHGGWTGGEFVLGGGGSGSGSGGGALTRREIIAKAAEERIKKLANAEQKQNDSSDGDGSSAA